MADKDPHFDLYNWRNAVASPAGPKSSSTRHVLLTLSLHMNALRIQAYSQGQLLSLSFSTTLLGTISALPYVSGPTYLVELGQIGGSTQFDRLIFGGTEQFDNLSFNVPTASVPESGTLALLGLGLVGLGISRRKKAA